jgi:hypothetical protein
MYPLLKNKPRITPFLKKGRSIFFSTDGRIAINKSVAITNRQVRKEFTSRRSNVPFIERNALPQIAATAIRAIEEKTLLSFI